MSKETPKKAIRNNKVTKKSLKMIKGIPKSWNVSKKVVTKQINNVDTTKIKKEAKDVGRATSVVLSAFTVVGLAWLMNHHDHYNRSDNQ